MRRRSVQKLDANHSSVCRDAEKMGFDIVELLKPVDILARSRKTGYVSFIEIKVEGRNTYTRPQLKFMSETSYPVAIVKSADELAQKMVDGQGLSRQQKDAIGAFLATAKGDKWNSEKIEKVLAV